MGEKELALEGLAAARLSADGRIKDVRADHVARYDWAAARTTGRVIDAGCNCGYGSAILADAGLTVTAIDVWPDGLVFAREHWDRANIKWMNADFMGDFELPSADAVVAFEIIEHLEDPRPLLTESRRVAMRLFASVPNEEVWPHEPRLWPAHRRHYTRSQLNSVLIECGWSPIDWWGQSGGASPVEPDVRGRTLVVECR